MASEKFTELVSGSRIKLGDGKGNVSTVEGYLIGAKPVERKDGTEATVLCLQTKDGAPLEVWSTQSLTERLLDKGKPKSALALHYVKLEFVERVKIKGGKTFNVIKVFVAMANQLDKADVLPF